MGERKNLSPRNATHEVDIQKWLWPGLFRSLKMITTTLSILSSWLSNSATSHVNLSVFVHQLCKVTADIKTVKFEFV